MFWNLDPEAVYEFTFLRHGESTGNAEGYLQGQSDFPLSETGILQVQALAQRWQGLVKPFDLILSSPLQRARQTAEILAAALSAPVEFEPLWMERNNGLLAGMTGQQAQEKYPQPAFAPPYQKMGQTGESQWELYLRAGAALDGLLKRPPGKYLIVSHGGLLNMALYAILGIPVQANFQGASFRFRNTSFARFRYIPKQHRWQFLSLNDHRHWLEFDDDNG